MSLTLTHVAVLAGGSSRRMGTDKRRVLLDGEELLARQVRRLASEGLRVAVVGGPPDVPTPARHVFDEHPGEGPMGGVLTALAACPVPVGIVAVDMPDVSVPLLRALAARSPELAAVPESNATLQPLHSVWGPDARRELAAAWEAGERSLLRVLATLPIDRIVEAQADTLAGHDRWSTSLDTPEDLRGRQSS